MPYKTIREMIEITGVTENALRYYSEKGILKPAAKKETGRREWLYDEEAVQKLKVILLYRNLDISVETIGAEKEGGADMAMLEENLMQLRNQRDKLDKKIAVSEMLIMIESLPEEEKDAKNRLIDKVFRIVKDMDEN